MPLLLILIFPLAEIATFIMVGGAIGVLPTLGLIIASSAIGAIMLRDAGMMTLLRLQRRQGDPAAILTQGGHRMLAGLLLLIPGFLTDIAAICLLIPPLRRPALDRAFRARPASGAAQSPSPTVIDGDFRRLDP